VGDSGEIFQRVRDALDIVDVISEHIPLSRAGKEFKGLCPFHPDRRPSMSVVPHKQIFYCFVCGSGGDVFKFVTNYHKMTHGEALKFLAQKAGIALPEFRPQRDGARSDVDGRSAREVISETNERACVFFEKTLQSPLGRTGLDYFHSRGLTDEMLAHFRLGMSPDSWTGLVNAAGRANITSEQLLQAGLTKARSDGSHYDAFRNRVIFPIIDATDRVIAFGGRVLEDRRDEAGNVVEAKYLNSPETPLFNKSASLYGVNHAKRSIIQTGTAVIVEGYMDVIACHQVGVTNVVATLGTALTSDHARALKRFCQTVVLIFDSDDAGIRAADRAMEIFVRDTLEVKIARVADGKDPCDFCLTHGGDAFRHIIDNATDMMTFQWRRFATQFQATNSVTAKQAAVGKFLDFVAAAMNGQQMDPLRQGLLITQIAMLLGFPAEEIRGLLRQRGSTSAPTNAAQATPSAEPAIVQSLSEERWVLGALLTNPNLYRLVREDLTLALFTTPGVRELAEHVIGYFEHASDWSECSLADFVGSLDTYEGMVNLAITIQREAEQGASVEEKLKGGMARLHDRAKAVELEEHMREMTPEEQLGEWKVVRDKMKQGGNFRRT